jgi:membrane-bound lytic murein transglycosylase D
MRSGSLLVLLCGMVWASALGAGDRATIFPVPPILEPNVAFWVDMFTKYSAEKAIFHDRDNPLRIYSVLDFGAGAPGKRMGDRAREKAVEAERKRLTAVLQKLGGAGIADSALSDDERRIRSLFDPGTAPETFAAASERVRSQTGLADSFRDGIVRSGKVLDATRRIFRSRGLPEELAALPHVESSYNPKAMSKAGAAGVWQFTKSTGRLFLAVNDDIDERWDPLLSADAAARLLKRNYDVTGSWPLAITAYNHGLQSIRKAMKEHDTNDLMQLILAYEYKPFGFASKNFYAEFLAALRVSQDPAAFFGALVPDPPQEFSEVELPVALPLDAASDAFCSSGDTLVALNPAFRRAVRDGKRAIPRLYRLRVPAGTDEDAAYRRLTSRGFLPRGAAGAWCRGDRSEEMERLEPQRREMDDQAPST